MLFFRREWVSKYMDVRLKHGRWIEMNYQIHPRLIWKEVTISLVVIKSRNKISKPETRSTFSWSSKMNFASSTVELFNGVTTKDHLAMLLLK